MVVIACWCVKCREYDTKKQNIVLKNKGSDFKNSANVFNI